MRRKSIRDKSHLKKIKVSDLDITSLIALCTILLCFLIQTYDVTNVQIDIPYEISLSKSVSKDFHHPAVLVQVSVSKIWVDRVLVLDASNTNENFQDEDGKRIVPLFDELVKKREKLLHTAQAIPHSVPFSGQISLVVDRSVKYSYLKKLIYTASKAGFKEYKFIVRGQEG